MSNTNFPNGFQCIGKAPGAGTYAGVIEHRRVAYNNTAAIYPGDPVINLATGYIARGAVSNATSLHAGVFVGCKYIDASGNTVRSNYWPGVTLSDSAYVVDAYIMPLNGGTPLLFVVQATDTNFTFADIGATCDYDIGTGAVAGGRGRSGATLNRSTLGTSGSDGTLPWIITGLYSSIAAANENGIDDTSNYNRVIVRYNAFGNTGINA